MDRGRWGKISDQPSLPNQDRLERHKKRLGNMLDGTSQATYGGKWSRMGERVTTSDQISEGYSSGESGDDEAGTSHQTEVSGKHVSSDQTSTKYRPDLSHPQFPALEAKLNKYERIRGFSNCNIGNLYIDTCNEIDAIYPKSEDKLRTFLLIRTTPIKQLSDTEHHLALALRPHLIGKVNQQVKENVYKQQYYKELKPEEKVRVSSAILEIIGKSNIS